MSPKTRKITGWILTGLIALAMILSAVLKLTGSPVALKLAAAVGFSASTYQLIGLIEVLSTVLFIVPRTGILGTLLLAAYLGGAIATHWQHQQPALPAVILECLVWITATIRFQELSKRIMGITDGQ
ncbi:DoxX family protein [Mucilaginibacter sp.]|uniref:DoxX family protein n=1 Tax=Mucilaginibacter sp. TaxID=1882438 RepID=UPI0026211708|nr:DoxX family protein [Mucilaginibacter sp.]MDB4920509.1 hypothetical protein [Mucilaginibacter sp.]